MTTSLTCVDMHTGGEPLRIVTSGYPPLPEGSILEKRAYVRDHLDHLRRILMFEPRGHADMYGALLVEPQMHDADLAVLFMHNEGYSTMCGHAIIALGRYAIDQGLVAMTEPMTTVRIECPCGMVVAAVEVKGGKAGAVSFESVPAFLFARDSKLELPGIGSVVFDIAYGGAFYALADCGQFGLNFDDKSMRGFVEVASKLTEAIKRQVELVHPEHDDLAFLYGTILTDGYDTWSDQPTKNICVFANAQVDRSPTGSGVTARLAAMHAKGQIGIGQKRIFESIIGTRFEGWVEREAVAGDLPAIVAGVKGNAYYFGEARFVVEDDDPLGGGFFIR